MRQVVVVGASLGGLRAGEALRDFGYEGRLVIVGDEAHMPYNRPPLSKQLLEGTMADSECMFAADSVEADWRLGVGAVGLDLSTRRVRLSGGGEVAYDGLVIATGASARSWPGVPLPATANVFSLRTLDDALALRAAVAEPRRNVVVLGAGFIGCEVAATLRKAGHEVAVVDVAAFPMGPLGPLLGAHCAQLHERHGVDLRLAAEVVDFESDQRSVRSVGLRDGTRLVCDVLLIATGAVPNTGWLRASGLDRDPGIVCDAWCSPTGHPEIVCVGDVASFPSSHANGGRLRVEHWSNAVEQARVAAENLLNGRSTRFDPVPSFWSDQYGIKIQAVGMPAVGEDSALIQGSQESGRFVVGYGRAGRLVAAVAFDYARAIPGLRRQIHAGAAFP